MNGVAAYNHYPRNGQDDRNFRPLPLLQLRSRYRFRFQGGFEPPSPAFKVERLAYPSRLDTWRHFENKERHVLILLLVRVSPTKNAHSCAAADDQTTSNVVQVTFQDISCRDVAEEIVHPLQVCGWLRALYSSLLKGTVDNQRPV